MGRRYLWIQVEMLICQRLGKGTPSIWLRDAPGGWNAMRVELWACCTRKTLEDLTSSSFCTPNHQTHCSLLRLGST